jgi:hypothetical protein
MTGKGIISIQVKLAWVRNDGRVVSSTSDDQVQKYADNGVDIMFVVHPELPVGWLIPTDRARYTIVSGGKDHFAEYAVTLPVYFADYDEE